MSTAIALPVAGDVRVVVPDSLDLITPFVLREQQDWFEDEIRFLRRALRPGQHAVDVGANYGVYTLSMAKTVGPTGSVLAFEPASSTARLLAEGIAANGFGHVRLEQAALSSQAGSAQLSLHPNAELNALVRGAAAGGGATETVPVTTLDEALARHGGPEVDFIKLDAEGEEANILRGGARLFREHSPLVLYEIRAGHEVHLELVDAFARLGYASYRLVPALGLLVPAQAGEPFDDYLLNLFACKPDRAEALEAQGLLLRTAPPPLQTAAAGQDWRTSLAALPYARPFAAGWKGGTTVEPAVALHAMSRDPAQAMDQRWAALQGSLDALRTLCSQDATALRLASLARVAQEAGERALAVAALRETAQGVSQGRQADPREPFLAPSARFEQMDASDLPRWLMAAVYEEFERLVTFSTFYAGSATLQRLETIARLGLGSEEMGRRLQLVRQRYGLA